MHLYSIVLRAFEPRDGRTSGFSAKLVAASLAGCLALVAGACSSDDAATVDAGDAPDDADPTGGTVDADEGDGGGEPSSSRWELLPTGHNASVFNDLYFASEERGWLIGSDEDGDPLVLHTFDGGDSWEPQDLEPENSLFDVHFHDEDHGWIAESGGGISVQRNGVWRTDNGGRDWQFVRIDETFEDRLRRLFFLDESTGWVFADALYRTEDGGQSWTFVADDDELGPLINQAYFADASIGTAIGNGGTLIHTRDGGATWSDVAPDVDNLGNLSALDFVDDDHGWAGSPSGAIVHTDDGGQTWSYAGEVDGTIRSISFIDTDRGWLATRQGEIHHSDDGGATWELEQTIYLPDLDDADGETAEPFALQMLHEDAGFAAGSPEQADAEAPVLRYR